MKNLPTTTTTTTDTNQILEGGDEKGEEEEMVVLTIENVRVTDPSADAAVKQVLYNAMVA
jgi:hypothetical protein